MLYGKVKGNVSSVMQGSAGSLSWHGRWCLPGPATSPAGHTLLVFG